MKVAIGSTNPAKINAVRLAFEKVWTDKKWHIIGLEVSSDVSNQPMSDLESIRGATNRAKNAIKKARADFGVGLEGGLQKIDNYYFDCGWVIVIDKKGIAGIASSARMLTPPSMMRHVFAGMELGEVDDLFFKKVNSKQGNGHFGLLTNNHLTRSTIYRDGVIAALARFLQPHLFQ